MPKKPEKSPNSPKHSGKKSSTQEVYPKLILPDIIQTEISKPARKATPVLNLPKIEFQLPEIKKKKPRYDSKDFYVYMAFVSLLGVLLYAMRLPVLLILIWFSIGTVFSYGLDMYLGWRFKKESLSTVPAKNSKSSSRSPNNASSQLIDWKKVLNGKVTRSNESSDAPRGASEEFFYGYLNRYFNEAAIWGCTYPIPGTNLSYSSDFELHINGLAIQIEIDEPYHGDEKAPHHCTDQGKDRRRDIFFLRLNWAIIRFSESQALVYPEECCGEIARVLRHLTGDDQWSDLAEKARSLPIEPCWDIATSKQMASQNYRKKCFDKSKAKLK